MGMRLGGRAVLDKCSQEAQCECRSSLFWEFYEKSELILENSMVAWNQADLDWIPGCASYYLCGLR